MDKLLKSIPLVILGILSAVLLVFVDSPPEPATTGASGEICAVTGAISSADQARIEALTADSNKEYLVEDFSGWMRDLFPSFVNDRHRDGWTLADVIGDIYIFERVK